MFLQRTEIKWLSFKKGWRTKMCAALYRYILNPYLLSDSADFLFRDQFIQQVFRHADIFLLLVAVNLALDGDVTFVTDFF